MSAPLVTVFTPYYNHQAYLDEYCAGLLAQSYSNVQLILVDDGSTDDSWPTVQRHADALRHKLAEVIVARHDNVGPSQQFLRYLPQVRGEYLSILESDDYYLPDKVAENVRVLAAHPEVGAVHSDVDYIYGHRIERAHWAATGRRIPTGDIFEALLVDNFVMTCSFCCRTELFRRHVDMKGYLERGYTARDYAFCLDLARHTRFAYLDRPLARYRVLDNSYIHSTNLEEALRREQGYHQIKLDYVAKYDGPRWARELAMEGMHEMLFLYGFRLRRIEQCLRSYRALMTSNPRRYRALPFRALALAVRNRSLWEIVRRIEGSDLARRAALRWFSLRNRGQTKLGSTPPICDSGSEAALSARR